MTQVELRVREDIRIQKRVLARHLAHGGRLVRDFRPRSRAQNCKKRLFNTDGQRADSPGEATPATREILVRVRLGKIKAFFFFQSEICEQTFVEDKE